jgi:hypothetical protein
MFIRDFVFGEKYIHILDIVSKMEVDITEVKINLSDTIKIKFKKIIFSGNQEHFTIDYDDLSKNEYFIYIRILVARNWEPKITVYEKRNPNTYEIVENHTLHAKAIHSIFKELVKHFNINLI